MTRPVTFLGKCKACKAGIRVDALIHPSARVAPARFTTLDGDRLRVISTAGRSRHYAMCECGRPAYLDQVRGTVTDHTCDARCVNATGPACECSCGGANHGSAHVVGGGEL